MRFFFFNNYFSVSYVYRNGRNILVLAVPRQHNSVHIHVPFLLIFGYTRFQKLKKWLHSVYPTLYYYVKLPYYTTWFFRLSWCVCRLCENNTVSSRIIQHQFRRFQILVVLTKRLLFFCQPGEATYCIRMGVVLFCLSSPNGRGPGL